MMRTLVWFLLPCILALIAQHVLFAPSEARAQYSTSIIRENGWSALTASMEKMHAAMGSIEQSGDSDVDFVKLMIPHHQAAIDMAKAELLYGNDPEIRRLAQEIIADQQSEIELMKLWQRRHGEEH
jgi:uncharacterized protein (DUF305 family)